MRAEVGSIERRLRDFAIERAEVEAGAALQARLREQLDVLPSEKQASALAALERVKAQIEAYTSGQEERQRTVQRLVGRIAVLRERAVATN